MNTFLADSPGDATRLYAADQSQRAAQANNAFATMLGQLNLRKSQAIQKNQFAAQMAMEARREAATADATAQQLALQRRNMFLQAQKAQRDYDLQNSYLEFQKDQAKMGVTPAAERLDAEQARKNSEDFAQASQLVEDPMADVDLTQFGNLTSTQLYALGQRRKSVLATAMQQHQNEENVAKMQNELENLKSTIPDKEPPATVGHLWWKTQNPAAVDYANQIKRRNQLAALLAPYQKNEASMVQANPSTMQFEAATPAPVTATGGRNGFASSLTGTTTATMPAPPNSKEGDVVHQKSTDKYFVVQNGQLVPYDYAR